MTTLVSLPPRVLMYSPDVVDGAAQATGPNEVDSWEKYIACGGSHVLNLIVRYIQHKRTEQSPVRRE